MFVCFCRARFSNHRTLTRTTCRRYRTSARCCPWRTTSKHWGMIPAVTPRYTTTMTYITWPVITIRRRRRWRWNRGYRSPRRIEEGQSARAIRDLRFTIIIREWIKSTVIVGAILVEISITFVFVGWPFFGCSIRLLFETFFFGVTTLFLSVCF